MNVVLATTPVTGLGMIERGDTTWNTLLVAIVPVSGSLNETVCDPIAIPVCVKLHEDGVSIIGADEIGCCTPPSSSYTRSSVHRGGEYVVVPVIGNGTPAC